MTKPTDRKKRNKLTVALLAPILIIVYLVGWSLYWIGQTGQRNAKQPQKPEKRKRPSPKPNLESTVTNPFLTEVDMKQRNL